MEEEHCPSRKLGKRVDLVVGEVEYLSFCQCLNWQGKLTVWGGGEEEDCDGSVGGKPLVLKKEE